MNFVSIIEKLLLWVEKDVSIEEHELNIKRLTSEINKYLIVNGQGKERKKFNRLELDVFNSINLFFKADDQSNSNLDRVLLINNIDLITDDFSFFSIYIQFQELNDNFIEFSNNNSALSLKIDNLIKNASWIGNQKEKNNAQIAARLIFLGLRLKFLDKGYAAIKTKILIDKLPLNRLFNSNGMIFGSSFLLRSSLILVREGLGVEFLEYTKDLSELILRRLEIKKESIIPMDDKIQNEKSLVLEHLRCITAILEAYTVLSDVRFLNAALKANDRVYPYIIKIKINTKMSRRNLINILISCNYMKLIKKQEKNFLLLCQT